MVMAKKTPEVGRVIALVGGNRETPRRTRRVPVDHSLGLLLLGGAGGLVNPVSSWISTACC